MNQPAIEALFRARLATLGWLDQTAWEGTPFDPAKVQGRPYQEVTFVYGESDAITLAGVSRGQGVFQVRLLWPTPVKGTKEQGARAKEIADAFPRNLVMSGAGGKAKVMRDAAIARGPVQGDRDVTVIRIRFADR